MKRSLSPRTAARGFTLVEVLIALSLLSILMVVLTGAISTLGRTEARIEQRLSDADDMRVADQFLRDVLGRASARTMARTQAVPSALFEGGPDALMWIGVMPARYGVGGRHLMRLGLQPGPSGSDLVLRYVPWAGQNQFPDWSGAAAQVIVRDVASVALRYLDDRSGQWVASWPIVGTPPREQLPGAIQLELDTVEGAWPPVVTRLAPLSPSDPSRRQFTVGGRQ